MTAQEAFDNYNAAEAAARELYLAYWVEKFATVGITLVAGDWRGSVKGEFAGYKLEAPFRWGSPLSRVGYRHRRGDGVGVAQDAHVVIPLQPEWAGRVRGDSASALRALVELRLSDTDITMPGTSCRLPIVSRVAPRSPGFGATARVPGASFPAVSSMVLEQKINASDKLSDADKFEGGVRPRWANGIEWRIEPLSCPTAWPHTVKVKSDSGFNKLVRRLRIKDFK